MSSDANWHFANDAFEPDTPYIPEEEEEEQVTYFTSEPEVESPWSFGRPVNSVQTATVPSQLNRSNEPPIIRPLERSSTRRSNAQQQQQQGRRSSSSQQQQGVRRNSSEIRRVGHPPVAKR